MNYEPAGKKASNMKFQRVVWSVIPNGDAETQSLHRDPVSPPFAGPDTHPSSESIY